VTFSDFVAGKSIAIVGPAPMPYDQSADIDGHDLVYRPGHSPIGGQRGDRIDIAFLNGQLGRQIYDDDHDEYRRRLEPADWWVYKGGSSMTHRVGGNYRSCIRPKLRLNMNAVTGMLFDLTRFDTGLITVYGADLYASGPGNAYEPTYDVRPVHEQANGVILHDPWKQIRIHRAAHATGKVVGDDRYLAAVTMTDDEYQAVIDRWRAALEEAT
jgi:hypothetical protein